MKNKGFTLLELLIVIVIIGILATLSLTHYASLRERAVGREARANLQLIAAAERIWKMESVNDAYTTCTCNCAGTGAGCCNRCPTPATCTGCNALLRLGLTIQNWTYQVLNVAGTGAAAIFTARATRVVGLYAGTTITLNQVDAWGGNFPK